MGFWEEASSTPNSLSAALAPAPSLSPLPSRLLLRRCSASDPRAQSQSPPSHAQSAQMQRDARRTWVQIPAPPGSWRHDMCSFHCKEAEVAEKRQKLPTCGACVFLGGVLRTPSHLSDMSPLLHPQGHLPCLKPPAILESHVLSELAYVLAFHSG